MKVAVSGGRFYENRANVYKTLDAIHAKYGIDLLIHGACKDGGADILAEDWAKSREVPYVGEPAKWKLNKKAAGPIRNDVMLTKWEPDLLVTFPGNNGTNNCIKQAESKNIIVIVVDDNGTMTIN